MRPIRTILTEPFKNFVKSLNPTFKIPYRQKVKEITTHQVAKLRVKVQDCVQTAEFMNISFDGWADVNSEAFLTILAHFRFFFVFYSLFMRFTVFFQNEDLVERFSLQLWIPGVSLKRILKHYQNMSNTNSRDLGLRKQIT